MLRNESGSDLVAGLLDDADVPKMAHVANICEVCYHVAVELDDASGHAVVSVMRLLGIKIRGDMDPEFWQDMAELIADCKRKKRPLALGDAFGVALARRENVEFITADCGELEGVRTASVARITVIR